MYIATETSTMPLYKLTYSTSYIEKEPLTQAYNAMGRGRTCKCLLKILYIGMGVSEKLTYHPTVFYKPFKAHGTHLQSHEPYYTISVQGHGRAHTLPQLYRVFQFLFYILDSWPNLAPLYHYSTHSTVNTYACLSTCKLASLNTLLSKR